VALDILGQRSDAIAGAEAALKIYESIDHPMTGELQKQLANWQQEPG